MSKHENDIRLTSCDKGKRQMASAAATAIVAVAWLGSAAVGMIFPAAAPLTSAIQSMIGILGTSGAAAW